MTFRRSLLRTLCTWLTCLMLGIVAAPTVNARTVAPTEMAASCLAEPAGPTASTQQAVRAELRTPPPPTTGCVDALKPKPSPPIVHERALRSALYLHHCALLL